MSSQKLYNEILEIGRLSLLFGRTYRMTLHDDEVTRESDTDHTVMLSLCACSLAKKLYPNQLDIGKVSLYALVHDLVEAYAGDTPTLAITDDARAQKEQLELEALLKINKKFGKISPFIPETIRSYERLDTPEARFVKLVDKIMPKITQTLNGGVQFYLYSISKEELINDHKKQLQKFTEQYGDEFPEVIELLATSMTAAEDVVPG